MPLKLPLFSFAIWATSDSQSSPWCYDSLKIVLGDVGSSLAKAGGNGGKLEGSTRRFHGQNKTQVFGAGGAANTCHLPRMSTWLHESHSHRDCSRKRVRTGSSDLTHGYSPGGEDCSFLREGSLGTAWMRNQCSGRWQLEQ